MVSLPKPAIQFQESLCSGSTRLNTFTSYPFFRNSSDMSLYISDFGSLIIADSPLRIMEKSEFLITALDFIVPEAPKMAQCRLSLVFSGRHTSCPFRSPKIIPVALSAVLSSSTALSSFSFIQLAVP